MQALRFAVCTAIFVCLATLLPFASGAAALELAPVMPASPPRTATVLRVPDDYTTIQAAIDAAQPGDEIRTVLGALPNPDDPPDYFAESLAISKTLTLSGGWNTSFTAVEGYSYLIPPAGRGMTIEPDDPITVTIRGFYVTGGDATGLGCGTISAGSRPGDFSADALGMDSSLRVATLLTPSVQGMGSAQTTDLNDWMATLDGLDAAGLYPGSTAALKRVRARIDQMAGAEAIGLNAAQVQAPAGPAADALDCGGGVFSDGANLIIENSVFAKNVASKANSGYGGGMCVANGNLQIESSEFTLNTASTTQGGEGGGLQVSSIPTGGVVTLRDLTVYRNTGAAGCAQGGGVSIVDYSQDNIVATVSIETSEFRENVTSLTCNSETGAASGGGLRVQHIPGVRIVGNQFLANMVGAQTIETMGGGLLLGRSPDAVVSGNTFKDNVASGLTTYQNNETHIPIGTGGGAFMAGSQRAQVIDNLFEGNVAALRVFGQGGGLSVSGSAGATYSRNRFLGNMGAFQPVLHSAPTDVQSSWGGGFLLAGTSGYTVTENVFSENYAVFRSGFTESEQAHGGGLAVYGSENGLIAGNVFKANIACGDCPGYGGGLVLVTMAGANIEPQFITVTANSLVDNAAGLTGDGTGGGMSLFNLNSVLVQGNRVVHNQASARGKGHGGGIALTPYFGTNEQGASDNVRIDGNVVTGNRAPTEAGGLLVWGPQNTVVANNLIVDNTAQSAGGVAYYGTAPGADTPQGLLVNNTVVSNTAEGILLSKWLTTTITVVNNIVVSHTIGVTTDDDSQVNLSYTLWHGNAISVTGGIAQTHALEAAPGFVDPAMGDYHLIMASPARNAGDPVGIPPAPPFDLDGVPRPYGPRVDLGAYEWAGGRMYLPLVTGDRTP